MRVYSLSVLQVPATGPATVLSTASDLASFSFYQRGSVAEFMTFFSKTVAERTQPGQRQTVQENTYMAHVYNGAGPQRLCGECIAPTQGLIWAAVSLNSALSYSGRHYG